LEEIPKTRGALDATRDAARAALSVVPVVGGPLQVAFEALFASPLEKRKEAWLQNLADVVVELGARVDALTPERLAEDEVFVTVVMQASQIAVRNHRVEKLQALRNAVLNSVLSPIDEDDKFIFLRLIDQLAPAHLGLLKFLASPAEWMRVHGIQNPGWSMGSISHVAEHCIPDFGRRREAYDQIVRDLQSEGLVVQGSWMNSSMSGHGMLEGRATQRGTAFLKFITDPSDPG
jgi:hypothetical protein